MQVKEIMHNVTKVSPDTNISEAARIMDKKVIGSVLIEENGKIIGIMTESDILRKIVAKGKNPDEVKVKAVMSYPIKTIDANEDITETNKKMDEHKIRRLIITENGEIVGIVTANSIAKNLKYALARYSLHTQKDYTRPEY